MDIIALALVVMEETEASTCNEFVCVFCLSLCSDSLLCWCRCWAMAYASVLFGTLTKWSDLSRLETRTKESNMCASIGVANPNAQ